MNWSELSELLQRPVAFHRIFAQVACGALPGLFLSQAFYWHGRGADPDGWFYKTQEEWEAETGMTRREQETARKILKDKGILEEKKQGIPCKLFYRINKEVLLGAIQTSMAENAKLDCTKPPCRSVQNVQTITETTTETTTERGERAERATPAPDRFIITQNQRDWAKQKCSGLDIDRETENFLDYHRAKGKRWIDWNAAWRKWMRDSATKFAPYKTKAEMNAGGRGFVH